MSSFDFTVEWDQPEGVHVLKLIGRMDLAKSMDLESMVIARLEEEPLPLVIQMAHMSYLPSAGIGAMLNIHRHCMVNKLKIVMAECPPEVKRLLDVVEIAQLMPMFETEAEAVAAART